MTQICKRLLKLKWDYKKWSGWFLIVVQIRIPNDVLEQPHCILVYLYTINYLSCFSYAVSSNRFVWYIKARWPRQWKPSLPWHSLRIIWSVLQMCFVLNYHCYFIMLNPFFFFFFFLIFVFKGTNGRQKTYEIFHVYCIFYSGFMCQTTVIFGITKDGSLVLII